MSSSPATRLEWQATEYRLHAGRLTARVHPGPGQGWRWTVHRQGPAGWVEEDRGNGESAEDAMGRAQAIVERVGAAAADAATP